MNTQKYKDPRQAAEYIGSSTSTLAKKRMTGDGPKFYRIGRSIRYTPEDLDAFMASRAAQSTSQYAA